MTGTKRRSSCRRATYGFRRVLVNALLWTAVFSVSAGLHWLSDRKLRRGAASPAPRTATATRR